MTAAVSNKGGRIDAYPVWVFPRSLIVQVKERCICFHYRTRQTAIFPFHSDIRKGSEHLASQTSTSMSALLEYDRLLNRIANIHIQESLFNRHFTPLHLIIELFTISPLHPSSSQVSCAHSCYRGSPYPAPQASNEHNCAACFPSCCSLRSVPSTQD